MSTVAKIYVLVLYDGKNISADITPSLISINYKDKVAGESDEIEITLEDKEALWQNGWYPQKGAHLTVTIGMDTGERLECGVFQIDEIELIGPPDTVTVKGLSTSVSKKLRTKNSYAHENKTLSQIINSVASKMGFKVVGTIENIPIARVTQKRQTDLNFLRKLADEYGYNFTIKDKNLVFVKQVELESRKHSLTVDKSDCVSYSFKDKMSEVYGKAKTKSHNPNSNKIIEGSADATLDDSNASDYDDLEIRGKTETEAQAGAKSKAQLHKKNSVQKTASISMPGNVLCLSGNNIDVTGFGILTGVYHLLETSHTISKNGYSCEFESKRVLPTSSNSKKIAKKKTTQKNDYAVKYYVLPEYDFRKK